MNLEKLKELLPSHTSGYLATIAENNEPDLRGWQLQLIEGGKFYFTTSATKAAFKQMKINPRIAFACSTNEGYTFRIYGKVRFINDAKTVAEIHDGLTDSVRAIYPTQNDNGFTVFCLEHGRVAYAKDNEAFQSFKF